MDDDRDELPALSGVLLRAERERQGLEPGYVAKKLGLTASTLKALELDDYDKLPGAVYVRGYLRRYCALLEIDSQAVVERFNAQLEVRDGEPQANAPVRLLRGKTNLGWMLLALAVVICLLLAWWLFSDRKSGPELGRRSEAVQAVLAANQQRASDFVVAPVAAAGNGN